MLLQLGRYRCQLLPQLCQFLCRLLCRFIGFAELFRQLPAMVCQLLQLFFLCLFGFLLLCQLIGTGQDTGGPVCRTAGHGAACMDDLSVQCDNAETVTVLPCHGQCTVHIRCHRSTSQGIVYNVPVICFTFHQICRNAAETGLMLQPAFPQGLGTNGIHGQECGSAAVPPFEQLDGFFAVLCTFHNDIGSRSTQCRFNRRHIPVRHLNQRGQGTPDAFECSGGCLIHDQLDRPGKAFIFPLQLSQHADAVTAVRQCCGELLMFLPCFGQLLSGFPCPLLAGSLFPLRLGNAFAQGIQFLLHLLLGSFFLFGACLCGTHILTHGFASALQCFQLHLYATLVCLYGKHGFTDGIRLLPQFLCLLLPAIHLCG